MIILGSVFLNICGTYLFTYDSVSHGIVKNNSFVTTFLDMSSVRKLGLKHKGHLAH